MEEGITVPKVRLTKNELKKQKDALKRYVQYLPALVLKKQQLQSEILKIVRKREKLKEEKAYIKAKIYEWVDVFSEGFAIEEYIQKKEVETTLENISGIDIPVYKRTIFEEKEYDLYNTPIWVEYGIEAIKQLVEHNAKIEINKKQEKLVREELRITTQRVNLFEKVMIPQSNENIKKIQIYLGDMQTAAVVTGKIAKAKIIKLIKR